MFVKVNNIFDGYLSISILSFAIETLIPSSNLMRELRRKPVLWVGEPKATQLGLKKGYLSTRWKVWIETNRFTGVGWGCQLVFNLITIRNTGIS